MLDLPKKFKMDTMSSETYLIPLIVIVRTAISVPPLPSETV